MPKRVFICVAEVSGDQHAAELVRALRAIDPTIQIEGVGGPLMRAAGATVHHETTLRANMGLSGLLRAVEVWRLLRWTRRHFRENRPDLLIGVDSPAMTIHFARLAKKLGVPVLQYVAPQLWAWRPGRIRKVRRWIDRLACILPFEEAYFTQRGVDARFVGHPLFDALDPARQLGPPDGFPGRPPVVGLLAGSRRSEATANFPDMLVIADRIAAELPGATFLSPTTEATHAVVRELAGGRADITIQRDGFDQLVPRCDLCIVVSGTATLHVAAHGIPMVVVYRVAGLVVKVFGRLMRTDTFALVNLLAQRGPADPSVPRPQRHIVPEFIPLTGPIDPAADTSLDLLRNPSGLADQRTRLLDLVRSLSSPGASMNVAKIALEMMGTGH